MAAPDIDPTLIRRLSSQLSRGEVILFTGAGFSLDARSRSGDPFPTSQDLTRALWDIAFPGEPLDPSSSLGDIFDVAVRTARNRTRDLIEARLRVDADSLSTTTYRLWFSMPWHRIYTLNVDDLDEVVARTQQLPRQVKVVSALREDPLALHDRLLSIHLNGTLADFPDITFAQRQYAERLAHPSFWYQALTRDLHAAPVLFIGTSLDEPPLWQHLEMRGRRGHGRELRPGSYLVTPSLPAARRAILQDHFNVDWIPMTQAEFAERVLGTLHEAQRQGLARLTATASAAREVVALQAVADLRTQPAQDLREYLMGREPLWADLGPEGFAVHRQFEAPLSPMLDKAGVRVLLLTGTGGSGKSTTLMRLGLEKQALGLDVRWVNIESEISIPRLRAAITDSRPDAVLIDDVHGFGDQAGPFLREIATDNPGLLVAATVRASRYEGLHIEDHLTAIPFSQLTVPHLQDEDIALLLDSLNRAQRLGRLRGKSRAEQVEAFTRESGRQLLVAMIQATSGERFDEKIARECRDLGPETGLMYAVVALATAERHFLTRQEIVLAAGEPSNESLNRLQSLLNQHLLTELSPNQIRLRHRVVADKAVEYFQSHRQLAEPIRGLIFALATGIDRARYPRGRIGKLLVRLMNHGWLIRHFPNDREAVRSAYDAVEDLLSWDHHYWLQRGSYEVEVGDLQLSQNLLEQARALAPADYMVQTEWAYMIIKRAAQQPASAGAAERVAEAFDELEDAVIRRGHQDFYPAHVMGSQGLAWARQAPLTRDKKLGLLARLRHVVDSALKHHPGSADIKQLARDLEYEYLIVASGQSPG